MADAIELQAILDRPEISAKAGPTHLKCHIELWPSAVLRQSEVPAATANICLVFDCSTSMIGEKIQVAMASAKHLVDILDPRHTISLVAFQSHAELLIDNARALSGEKELIKRQIDRTTSVVGGATRLGEGIRCGLRALEGARRDAKVMIILSDGAATSPEDAADAAQQATNEGVQLFAVGIGEQYDAAQLLRLVRPSNGAVFGDSDLDRIQGAFATLVGRIESFVATRVRLLLSFSPGVRPGMAFKTGPEKAGLGPVAVDEEGRARFLVGNIERAKTYGFLLQLSLPALEPGELEIARATLFYDVPSRGLHDARTDLCISVACAGEQCSGAVPDSRVLDALQSASVAQLMEDLVDTYDRDNRRRTADRLRTLREYCKRSGDHEMGARLTILLDELERNGRISKADLNACLVASTANATGEPPTANTVRGSPSDLTTKGSSAPYESTEICAASEPQASAGDYDVVLVDVGDTPIRVVRQIRDATGLRLTAIGEMVKKENAIVRRSMSRAAADELRDRIVEVGGRAEVRRTSGSSTAAA